ncbi:carbohydrate ABC transporter substrate-binding protein, CUT1 family [Caloramator quimbayensis]|uniref:Maltodextrin-binding protein n=1 Tax=Caloramator quimbayensis TaxID=1147123 RepID=A0A1T4YCK4_9CLOT|nr:maltose ABC transporter substrate-binding protein [Caloramator quimbayensis]SKA99031.1 carbohydrate ABC transporter substrate-binding protein, CUT1 family [Caloramator quimbayensis]
MKGIKKIISLVCIAVLIGSLFVGCGKKSETSTTNQTNQTQETKTPKNLIVWSHLTDKEVAEVDKVAQEWAKKTGNTVKVQADKGDFQAYLQAANSSKAPDIMFGIAHDNLGTFQKAQLLAEVPSDVVDRSKYVPMALDAVSYDGKLFGIPLAMETYALFYNTDKLSAPPATMEDLIAAGQKNGFQYDINNFYFTYAFIAANGGYVFKNNGGALDPNDIGLGNEGAIKGYQMLADFVQKYKFMPATLKGDDAKAAFQKGKTALYISGPWDVQGFKDAGVKFAVAPLPKTNGQPTPSFVGIQAAFVNANSKNQAEAWDLMKYLVENTPMPLLKSGNRIPVLNSELEKDEVKNDSIISAFAEQAKYGTPMPNIPEMAAVWKPAGDNLTLLTSGKSKPDAVAKNIVDQVKQGIAQQQK